MRRLTIELDEGTAVSSQISQAASSVFSGYDILAVKVVGPNSFNNACLNMAAPSPFAINIIQIDLAANTRLPFFFKRNTAGKAISDGAFFEICYGGALDGSNEYGRRNLIAGVKEIVRVTGGKGIIFSSNVKNALHLRSPYDVINLWVEITTDIYGLMLNSEGQCLVSTKLLQRRLCLTIARHSSVTQVSIDVTVYDIP